MKPISDTTEERPKSGFEPTCSVINKQAIGIKDGGNITSTDHFSKEEGMRRIKREARQKLLEFDPQKLEIGAVLRNQKYLIRREMYRRRLFPIQFDFAAKDVNEAELLVPDRPGVPESLLVMIYLIFLLFFLSFALDITRTYKTVSDIKTHFNSITAVNGTFLNRLSLTAATDRAATNFTMKETLADTTNMRTIWSKIDVATWFLFGLVPEMYERFGSGNVVGNCLRMTVVQVKLEPTSSFKMGYESLWPFSYVSTRRKIPSSDMYEKNPLTQPSESPFPYQYSFVEKGKKESFEGRGGYVQTVCASTVEEALVKWRQGQPFSRFAPWFLPLPLIADRRTAQVFFDFFVTNPSNLSIAHVSAAFAFSSAGSVEMQEVNVESMGPISSTYIILKFTFLGLFLICFLWITVLQAKKAREIGFIRSLTKPWMVLFFIHFLASLGCLISFGVLEYLRTTAPTIEADFDDNGNYTYTKSVEFDNIDGFIEFSSKEGRSLTRISEAFYACGTLMSACGLTGCILYFQFTGAVGGSGRKTLELAFRKLFFPIIACTVTVLAALLVLVCLANTTLGYVHDEYAGFYVSLTTVAAFLLGGFAGNIDIFNLGSSNALSTVFLFLASILVCMIFLISLIYLLILRTYEYCADQVDDHILSLNLNDKLFRTRYEACNYLFKGFIVDTWRSIRSLRGHERLDYREFQLIYNSNAVDGREDLRAEIISGEEGDELITKYADWMLPPLGVESAAAFMNIAKSNARANISHSGSQVQERNVVHKETKIDALHVSIPKVYRLAYWSSLSSFNARKKLLAFIFAVVLTVGLSFQAPVALEKNMRLMMELSIGASTYEEPSILLPCTDLTLSPPAVPNVDVTVIRQNRPMTAIYKREQIYSWLTSTSGFINIFFANKDPAFDAEMYSTMEFDDGRPFVPFSVGTWNTLLYRTPVRFRVTVAGAISHFETLGFYCNRKHCDTFIEAQQTDGLTQIRDLVAKRFINDAVQSFEIAFGILNANNGSFFSLARIEFSFEGSRSGSPITRFSFSPMQPYTYGSVQLFVGAVFQALCVVILVVLIIQWCTDFIKLRKKLKNDYNPERITFCFSLGVFLFDDLFNLADAIGFCIVSVASTLWVFFVTNAFQTKVFAAEGLAESLDNLKKIQYMVNQFSQVENMDGILDVYFHLGAVLSCLAILRILKFFRKNKHYMLIFATTGDVSEVLFFVTTCAALVYLGFTYTCYLSFGPFMYEYSTVQKSFISSFLLSFGCMRLSAMFNANSIVSQFLVYPYLFFVSILMFGLLLCVLLRSISYRWAEVSMLESLKKVHDRTLRESIIAFFKELFKGKENETIGGHYVDPASIRYSNEKRSESDDRGLKQSKKDEEITFKRRQKPLPVVEMPQQMVTALLSDEQYLSLPTEIQEWASQEVSAFTDRLRKLQTQFQVAGRDMLILVETMENDVVEELQSLERELAQEESLLTRKINVFKTQALDDLEKMNNYTRYLEHALVDRQQILKLIKEEVNILKAKADELNSEVNRYAS